MSKFKGMIKTNKTRRAERAVGYRNLGIGLALILVAYFTVSSARAEESDEFSGLWYMHIDKVLVVYIDYDDKEDMDRTIDRWIDGFIGGMIGTYNYQAGLASELSLCIEESGMTPASLRKQLLAFGRDPDFAGTAVSTFIYGSVHLSCAHVIGEYETSEDHEGEDT